MELSNLKPAEGSIKSRKRIARGEGSGRGGTSTRGHKGAKSRSGYSKKMGFEGGQMPLQRRVPKYGFKNRNRVEYVAINLKDLQALADKYKLKKVDLESLKKHRIIAKSEVLKVLGNGALKVKLEVHAHAFSKAAEAAIEAAGGKTVKL
tara:strand:- start:236 stop:682 length:447 start_codon:yes stop_codon:yes gene_type:complete